MSKVEFLDPYVAEKLKNRVGTDLMDTLYNSIFFLGR